MESQKKCEIAYQTSKTTTSPIPARNAKFASAYAIMNEVTTTFSPTLKNFFVLLNLFISVVTGCAVTEREKETLRSLLAVLGHLALRARGSAARGH